MGLGGGEGVGAGDVAGPKESGLSLDILPKENNGFTRIILLFCDCIHAELTRKK